MSPTVFLDMDGVLVDFVGGVMRWHGLHEEHRDGVDSWDGIPAVLSRLLGHEVTDASMWETIENVAFWRELAWLEHGRELFRRLAEIADVTIMSTPCHHAASAAGKLEWLEREIPNHARRYALTPCKGVFARPGAILVDDGEHNVTAFRAAGGRAFLWPATWNSYRRAPQAIDVEKCVASIASAFRRSA